MGSERVRNNRNAPERYYLWRGMYMCFLDNNYVIRCFEARIPYLAVHVPYSIFCITQLSYTLEHINLSWIYIEMPSVCASQNE